MDLWFHFVLAIVAVSSYLLRLRGGVSKWVVPPSAATAAVAVTDVILGFLLGLSANAVISLLPYIRSRAESEEKQLPRVPIVLESSLIGLAALSLITTAFLTLLRVFGAPIPNGHYWLVFGPVLLFVATGTLELLLPFRRTSAGWMYRRDLRRLHQTKVIDAHDRAYVHGDIGALRAMVPSHLYKAANGGNLDDVRRMLDEGVDPDTRGVDGWTPLMIASAEQHPQVVKELLSKGADPNALNSAGRSALMFAARYGNLEIARMLLEAGADPDLKNTETDWPALCAAAAYGRLPMARLLLRFGARTDSLGVDGKAADELARERGYVDVAELIQQGKHSGGAS